MYIHYSLFEAFTVLAVVVMSGITQLVLLEMKLSWLKRGHRACVVRHRFEPGLYF